MGRAIKGKLSLVVVCPKQDSVVTHTKLEKTPQVFRKIPERRSKRFDIPCEPFDPTENPNRDRAVQAR
jgi:hypothetical protein